MTDAELVTRPRPALTADDLFVTVQTAGTVAAPDGAPATIQAVAGELIRQIHAGSVDADSFADNIGIALEAMGLEIPGPFRGMVANAIRQGYAS